MNYDNQEHVRCKNKKNQEYVWSKNFLDCGSILILQLRDMFFEINYYKILFYLLTLLIFLCVPEQKTWLDNFYFYFLFISLILFEWRPENTIIYNWQQTLIMPTPPFWQTKPISDPLFTPTLLWNQFIKNLI